MLRITFLMFTVQSSYAPESCIFALVATVKRKMISLRSFGGKDEANILAKFHASASVLAAPLPLPLLLLLLLASADAARFSATRACTLLEYSLRLSRYKDAASSLAGELGLGSPNND
jgi:hypothetical protein